MPTLIKIEGDSPYLLPHVDHISAIAHGENVDLTMYVALPGHADLEQIYVQLSLPAADDLLYRLQNSMNRRIYYGRMRSLGELFSGFEV